MAKWICLPFITAAVILLIIPGPDMAYCIATGIGAEGLVLTTVANLIEPAGAGEPARRGC